MGSILKRAENIMHVEKELIEYSYEGASCQHHILIFSGKTQRHLLSTANLYLKEVGSRSVNTSGRYSGNLKSFFTYLLAIYGQEYGVNFWIKARESDIRQWQNRRVHERDQKRLTKPGDKTIHQNAELVHDFYTWAKKHGFPVLTLASSKDWHFNFKDESLLAHVKGPLAGQSTDHSIIDTKKRRSDAGFNKKEITIMSDSDIKNLMHGYSDPVYPSVLIMALATGMREEGLCQMPYIGQGDNHHIRSYPEIKNTIRKGMTAKTFSLTVIEKGKQRTLQVNMKAWKATCKAYLPTYYERRKKFQKRHPKISANSVFFLNKKGDPITPKMISDMTYVAKQNLEPFPWSFHSSRDWFATNFMIENLNKSDIHNAHYDAAVEESLRKQLGHEDIKTTYLHYIRMASLVIATKEGMFDYALKAGSFWNNLSDNV